MRRFFSSQVSDLYILLKPLQMRLQRLYLLIEYLGIPGQSRILGQSYYSSGDCSDDCNSVPIHQLFRLLILGMEEELPVDNVSYELALGILRMSPALTHNSKGEFIAHIVHWEL